MPTWGNAPASTVRARGWRAALAAVSLSLAAAPAAAWGSAGHEAVGAVADALVRDATRREIARLLDAEPERRRGLAGVATWADRLRGTDAHRPAWHYDNLPACGPVPPREAWCAGGDCATARIEAWRTVLADVRRPPAERSEALKWIVHLVGDVHQPMHAVTHAYAAGRRDAEGSRDDRGGNNLAVRIPGEPPGAAADLHGLWDHVLVDRALGLDGRHRLPAARREALIARARRVAPERLGGTPLAWAEESNRIARRVAYRLPGFACRVPPAGEVELDERYLRAAEAQVPKRLALAGARLARLLDETLR